MSNKMIAGEAAKERVPLPARSIFLSDSSKYLLSHVVSVFACSPFPRLQKETRMTLDQLEKIARNYKPIFARRMLEAIEVKRNA